MNEAVEDLAASMSTAAIARRDALLMVFTAGAVIVVLAVSHQSFQILRGNTRFVLVMAAGSIAGTVVGGLLLGVVPTAALIPILAGLLRISAVKVWRHQ